MQHAIDPSGKELPVATYNETYLTAAWIGLAYLARHHRKVLNSAFASGFALFVTQFCEDEDMQEFALEMLRKTGPVPANPKFISHEVKLPTFKAKPPVRVSGK